jgi:hypothetical protein
MKHFWMIMMIAGVVCACGQRASQTEGMDTTDSTAVAAGQDSLMADAGNVVAVETVKFEKNDSTAEVSLLVQWPVSGDKVIVDSLRKHICWLLDGEFDDPKDIQTYGESLFESLSADWHDVYDEMEPDDRICAFSKTHEITKMVETDRYITYFYRTHEYSGGAHGFTTEVGFTFRKSDGKQIPLLTNTDSPKLSALIKEGVRRHFSGDAGQLLSDEALLDYLFAEEVSSLNHIPLPGNSPYLSDTGVVFNYTQYEIAPYSSGIIIFEIPFQEIRPFLTPEASELIQSSK